MNPVLNSTRTTLSEAKDSLNCSRIVAGCMKWGVWGANYNTQQVFSLLNASLEIGVTTFDHADIYGHYTTEELFGNALKLVPNLRSKMELITKCGINLTTPNRPQYNIKSYRTDKAHILQSVENSLQNLHTDYIDLLLIHRPSPLMHPDEIAEVFQELKSSGKVLHFGVSNFTTHQFDLLNSRIPLCTNQIAISPLHLDPFLDGQLDQCLQHRIKPMAWSPLGGGALFGETEDERNKRIQAVARRLQKKYAAKGIDQILLAWLLQHPSSIMPVLGTSKAYRIADAVAACSIQLTNEEWFEIWQASTGVEVP